MWEGVQLPRGFRSVRKQKTSLTDQFYVFEYQQIEIVLNACSSVTVSLCRAYSLESSGEFLPFKDAPP